MLKIERSIKIRASISSVWELFSTRENLRKWFEPSIEIDVCIGGKHRHVAENQLITGEVTEIEPMKRITLSWFEDGPDTDWLNPIRFTFSLQKVPDGTLVTFLIYGFEQIGKPTYQGTFEAYERGTDHHHLLENLKELAESMNPGGIQPERRPS